MPSTLSLNGNGWIFKGFVGEDWLLRGSHLPETRDQRGWLPATVPSSVQHDLWQAGEIPDPYFERNSLQIEWTADRTWVYKRAFRPAQQNARARLKFHGVDYHARFFLNGESLGEHHSMYTPALFEVTNLLKWDTDNHLAVVIDPAPAEQPQIGYTSKVRTHKSRMGYWWDFCPRFVHQGIWSGAELLVTGPAAIEDVWVRPELEPGYASARLHTSVELSVLQPTTVRVEINIRSEGCPTTQASAVHRLEPGRTRLPFELRLDDPCLWWPNGMGPQPLYEAEVIVHEVNGQGKVLSDSRAVRFGVREVRLLPNEGASPDALPYTLAVKGQRVYLRGWNWVPMDALFGVERPAKLRHLLELAKAANVNLLRVWGGGLIEKESFYDLCDRLGILVWQEFIQSSSGIDNNAPTDPDFIAWMAEEARQIVPLRRNHPSLAIFCGGNELMDAPERPLTDAHPMLAALKQVVNEEAPDCLWLPTSSSGKVFSNSLEHVKNDPASLHDVHGPWEYQGLEAQYTLYNQTTSLLHSEFGAEGLTNRAALDAVISPERQLPITLDNPVWFHLSAWWVKAPQWETFFGNLPDVASTLRATQFTQFEGVRYAIEANRRRAFHNSGSIPWQFNEPYPNPACTSAVDYYGEPKPIYYGVKNAYAPAAVSARYPTLAWAGRESFEAQLWAIPAEGSKLQDARLSWRLVDFNGKMIAQDALALSTEDDHPAPAAEVRAPLADIPTAIFFLDLRLEAGSEHLTANRYLFTRAANLAPILTLPPARIQAEVSKRNSTWQVTLTNTGDVAAPYVQLSPVKDPRKEAWANLSQNYFTLFPGEQQVVEVTWENLPEAERKLKLWAWNVEESNL